MNAPAIIEREPPSGSIPPMPPKVAAAISKVMGGVPKLTREARNTHGNYNFASIDDFLEAVRPLCAESGLIILQDEDASEMIDGGPGRDGKARRFLSITYKFTLAHSSGETWAHRPSRTIIVDASMGSQAYGAAQSYTLKLFERSLFQIATGEKGQDVDEHASVDLPRNGRKRSMKEISANKQYREAECKEIGHDIQGIATLAELLEYKDEKLTPEFMGSLGNGQFYVEEVVARREEELQAAEGQTEEESSLTRDAMIEFIQGASEEDKLQEWKESGDYKRDLTSLPKAMQLTVRKAGAMKMESLRMAATHPIEAG